MEDPTSPTGSPVAAAEPEQSPPNIPAAENSEPEKVLLSPPAEEKFALEKDEEEVNSVAELSKEEVNSVVELSEEEVPAPEPSEAYASELPEASTSEPPTLEAPSSSELCEPPAPALAEEVSGAPAPALAPVDEINEAPASVPVDEVSETPASVPVDEVSETPASVPADEVSEIPVSVPADGVSKDPVPAPESEASEPTAPASVNGNGNVTEANVEAVNNHTAPEVVVSEKPQEKKEEDSMPPEVDSVAVPPHWHAKHGLHVTSIGGFISQEELSNMFSEFGKISSIVFENERKEAAIIRYETATAEGEELVAKTKEKLQNAQLGDRSLRIEAFRSDSLLFIGNLTPDIDDEMLRKMFEQHGTIERAFVLRNAAGQSKRYGFVEYSLKSQALTAKMAMGNINMDGRVLRVEWSDCKKIADMFSTVLFVDRIPKENPNVEASLRSLFGQYGKVRDCHLAIGMSNQFRGFGFIDFYHSLCADMAHEALDGHELEGHSIRVSFANPTKSAQSYKMRFGSQPAPAPYGHGGRGVHPGMMGNAPVRGHVPMPTPSSGQRFMGHGRTGMMGMGIGMQFGRGSHVGQALHDHGHPGGGTGMLGAGAAPAGMMGRPPLMNSLPARRGMAAGATLAPIPRLPGQGHSSINPATIAQVASAQAKAREVKAREEYYQNQPQQTVDTAFKQGDSQYGYQQQYHQQMQQQQTAVQAQYQQQLGQSTQQPYTQYYSQPAQGYIPSQQTQQQQQQGQYSQSAQYYQQQPAQQELAVQPQSYGYVQPYTQQYGQQYGAPAQHQYSQPYNQPASQISTQQYQQAAQPQVQAQYSQPYNQPMPQNSAPQYQQINAATPVANAGGGIVTAQSQDGSQQQAYTAYYNQQQPQPQLQPQAQPQQNVAQVASGAAQTSNVVGTSQQSLEAQWAAYYASQAAYQQAASYPQQQQQQQPQVATSYNEQPVVTPDVGQKRSADQMESGSQNQQLTYNYQQQMPTSYTQQVPTGSGAYQQNQAMTATAYQQQTAVPPSGYQMQPTVQPYQQQPAATGYQQPVPATVSAVPVGDGYQQQQSVPAAAVFQPVAQGQAVNAPVYDYNKRPRF